MSYKLHPNSLVMSTYYEAWCYFSKWCGGQISENLWFQTCIPVTYESDEISTMIVLHGTTEVKSETDLASNYHTTALISHTSKVMLKIL